jgi:nicotinamidase-related amidase
MAPKTAVILVDPLNDFLHPEGKLYSTVQESIKTTQIVPNLQSLVKTAREAHIPIFYALHQGYRDGVHDGWQHMNPSLARIGKARVFEEGSWGAKIYDGLEPQTSNGDVVVSRHWNSRYDDSVQFLQVKPTSISPSGFANTDLDYQLRQRGISHVVMAGMTANTCLESTARYAREM